MTATFAITLDEITVSAPDKSEFVIALPYEGTAHVTYENGGWYVSEIYIETRDAVEPGWIKLPRDGDWAFLWRVISEDMDRFLDGETPCTMDGRFTLVDGGIDKADYEAAEADYRYEIMREAV
jgi:hypothetical protein